MSHNEMRNNHNKAKDRRGRGIGIAAVVLSLSVAITIRAHEASAALSHDRTTIPTPDSSFSYVTEQPDYTLRSGGTVEVESGYEVPGLGWDKFNAFDKFGTAQSKYFASGAPIDLFERTSDNNATALFIGYTNNRPGWTHGEKKTMHPPDLFKPGINRLDDHVDDPRMAVYANAGESDYPNLFREPLSIKTEVGTGVYLPMEMITIEGRQTHGGAIYTDKYGNNVWTWDDPANEGDFWTRRMSLTGRNVNDEVFRPAGSGDDGGGGGDGGHNSDKSILQVQYCAVKRINKDGSSGHPGARTKDGISWERDSYDHNGDGTIDSKDHDPSKDYEAGVKEVWNYMLVEFIDNDGVHHIVADPDSYEYSGVTNCTRQNWLVEP
ncbi:hypothetical protein FWF74_00740 [Candidatus Saccharibacteria bacterium]|nr:hypothetical protein [Candidatus Saccharibacteria bacterium]MCL1963306.1 hypothetical protein [Candidatus Saccharibacteria bacterium]